MACIHSNINNYLLCTFHLRLGENNTFVSFQLQYKAYGVFVDLLSV